MSKPLTSIRVDIPGAPRPWQRTTTARHNQTGRIVRLTPEQMRVYKRHVASCGHHARLIARSQSGREWPTDRLYRLRLDVGMPRRNPSDWDNFGKLVCDALEGILWDNDRQVWDGRVVKHVCRDEPMAVLRVKVIAETDLVAPWTPREAPPAPRSRSEGRRRAVQG